VTTAWRQGRFVVANEGSKRWSCAVPGGGRRRRGERCSSPPFGRGPDDEPSRQGSSTSADRETGSVRADEFDAVVLPGGVANPDQLRTDPAAVHFVRSLFEPASRQRSSATAPGPWSRPDWSRDAPSPRGPACGPTSAMPVALGRRGGRRLCRRTQRAGHQPETDDLPVFCSTLVDVFAEERSSAPA